MTLCDRELVGSWLRHISGQGLIPIVGRWAEVHRAVGDLFISQFLARVTNLSTEDRHHRAAAHVGAIIDHWTFATNGLEQFNVFLVIHVGLLVAKLPRVVTFDLVSEDHRLALGSVNKVFCL